MYVMNTHLLNRNLTSFCVLKDRSWLLTTSLSNFVPSMNHWEDNLYRAKNCVSLCSLSDQWHSSASSGSVFHSSIHWCPFWQLRFSWCCSQMYHNVKQCKAPGWVWLQTHSLGLSVLLTVSLKEEIHCFDKSLLCAWKCGENYPLVETCHIVN